MKEASKHRLKDKRERVGRKGKRMTKWVLKQAAGGRMRFSVEPDFLLTNSLNAAGLAQCSEPKVAVSRRLWPPLISTVRYTSCVCLTQRGIWPLSEGRISFFFEHSQCVSRTGLKPAIERKKRGTDKCTTCFCQVASGLKPTFFVTCWSQQCSQTIRAFWYFFFFSFND